MKGVTLPLAWPAVSDFCSTHRRNVLAGSLHSYDYM
jgi:hypothetical protein